MLINNFIYDNLSAQLYVLAFERWVDFSHTSSDSVKLLPENNKHEVISGVAVYEILLTINTSKLIINTLLIKDQQKLNEIEKTES